MPYKKEDLNYIAGIIDGEAYVGLSKRIEKRRKIIESYCYLPEVTIAMREKQAVDFIDNLFEGIYFIDSKGYYHFSVTAQIRVKKLLNAVLPFLKVKKEQAEIVLKFIERRQKIGGKRYLKGKTTYTKVDDEDYYKLRSLHQGAL